MVDYNAKPFGVNAEQEYLLHLQNIIHIQHIYKLVEADTEYIDLLANHKIEEVEGWGCRLLFTRPKQGIDHSINLSVHNDASGFVRTVDIAYVDIPCRIDRVYYDNVHQTRWIDALGDNFKILTIETQLKENISTQIADDINDEIENALSDPNNYKKGTGDTYKKAKEIAQGQVMPTGNYYEIKASGANDMNVILDFLFNISSKFRSKNTVFQKGYYFDNSKPRTEESAWSQLKTNTPTLKRIGVIIDSMVINKLSTDKLATSPNIKYIDLKERFAWVKETNFRHVLKTGKKHEDYTGRPDGTSDAFNEVYEDKKLIVWMGDVRVPVLKIREPKQGLEYKYETENGLNWFFHKSRVYVGLATCLNYVGLFADTSTT